MSVAAPCDLTELRDRANHLAGLTLGELAHQHQQRVPPHLRVYKGWVGQLLETALGASAGNQACQDFPHLGVELKTIPVNRQYQPLETTYVCVAPLFGQWGQTWKDCAVYNKLSHVLWVPILALKTIPLKDRLIGMPFFWSPNSHQEAQLRQDWEEIMEKIALGHVESITAELGEVLQLRPKAANRRALTRAIGPNGQYIQTLPRGFYLKKNLTSAILAQEFEHS